MDSHAAHPLEPATGQDVECSRPRLQTDHGARSWFPGGSQWYAITHQEEISCLDMSLSETYQPSAQQNATRCAQLLKNLMGYWQR